MNAYVDDLQSTLRRAAELIRHVLVDDPGLISDGSQALVAEIDAVLARDPRELALADRRARDTTPAPPPEQEEEQLGLAPFVASLERWAELRAQELLQQSVGVGTRLPMHAPLEDDAPVYREDWEMPPVFEAIERQSSAAPGRLVPRFPKEESEVRT